MTRRFSPLTAMRGLVAALSLATAAGAAPAIQAQGAQPIREFVSAEPTARPRQKKIVRRTGGKLPTQVWQFDKQGNALDGRGDYRSAKRLRRRIAGALVGHPISGRQWRKIRKLFRGSPIFTTPTSTLTAIAGLRSRTMR